MLFFYIYSIREATSLKISKPLQPLSDYFQMRLNDTKAQIINFIASSELKEAIKLTMRITKDYNKEYFFNAVIISGELHHIENATRSGQVPWERELAEKSKLADRILRILDKIDGEIILNN